MIKNIMIETSILNKKVQHIFHKHLTPYASYLRATTNIDNKTIYIDIKHIEMFERFIYFNYQELSIEEVDNSHVEEFKIYCFENLKNSNKTINSKLKTLNRFFNYLTDIKHVYEYNFMFKVKKLRNENEKKPTILSSSEVKLLLDTMREYPYGIREVVISKLILQTALNINTILNIKYNDIDAYSKTLRVTSSNKNKVTKEYPLSDSLVVDLKEYLGARWNFPVKAIDKEYLFLSNIGNKYNIRNYQLFFKESLIKSDLPNTISPRHLRSTALFNIAKIIEEEKLKEIAQQNKVLHYYELAKNPLNNLI